MKFGPGMYYFDTAKSNKPPVKAYSFLSTVKNNKREFSQREIEGADRDNDLQRNNDRNSLQDYQNIITNNKIINTKVTAYDINSYESIYGL